MRGRSISVSTGETLQSGPGDYDEFTSREDCDRESSGTRVVPDGQASSGSGNKVWTTERFDDRRPDTIHVYCRGTVGTESLGAIRYGTGIFVFLGSFLVRFPETLVVRKSLRGPVLDSPVVDCSQRWSVRSIFYSRPLPVRSDSMETPHLLHRVFSVVSREGG